MIIGHQYIKAMIPNQSRVLDLGCGTGELLSQLVTEKQVIGYGIDISFHNVQACIKQNISVYQGNINEGLKEFSDQSYDVVILSQTLQEIHNPLFLIDEMLRVGKQVIVSFPNFGHIKARFDLLFGHAPVTKTLPYHWYNTPNIRAITRNDFWALCQQHQIQVISEIPLFNSPLLQRLAPRFLSNLMAHKVIFLLQRPPQ